MGVLLERDLFPVWLSVCFSLKKSIGKGQVLRLILIEREKYQKETERGVGNQKLYRLYKYLCFSFKEIC